MWKSKEASVYINEVREQGYTLLEGFIPADCVGSMAEAFKPILQTRLDRASPDRDPFLLEILEGIIGTDPVMCQLATDTPLKGSDYQDIHRDTEGLFFELPCYTETPAYQLALNFPLCDILDDSIGPLQIAKATHKLTSYEQDAMIAAGLVPLKSLYMKRGDAIIRDVRGLHRGTPNLTDIPRPMVVVGYSRKWLRRPEVGIKVPESVHRGLGQAAKRLLRFEEVVKDEVAAAYDGVEKYDAKTLTSASGQSITL